VNLLISQFRRRNIEKAKSKMNVETESEVDIGVVDFDACDSPLSTRMSTTENDGPKAARDSPRGRTTIKLVIGLLLLGFVAFVILDSLTNRYVRDGIDSFLDWIEENSVEGIFLFVLGAYVLRAISKLPLEISHMVQEMISLCLFDFLVYFAATILFIPGSILTLGAGFVFASSFGLGLGLVIGVFAVFLGASLGATASFFIGRYLLRDQATKLTKKYAVFEALDVALQENGLKILVLLRLSPIVPFNAINYICGVTAVSIRDYILALFAILPGTTLYVFLGASAGSLSDSASSGDDSTVTITVVVLGIVLGFIAIWISARYAKKELNRVLEQRRAESEQSEETAESNIEQGVVNHPRDRDLDCSECEQVGDVGPVELSIK
jgi:uncharacterized membrane protein YdjX (TVP38/TMEM64 family)